MQGHKSMLDPPEWYTKVNKSTVCQDARLFKERGTSQSRCRDILMKFIYLVYLGESFNCDEATEFFFALNNLFRNKNPQTRQMMYLAIKELTGMADNMLMATAEISKDIQAGSSTDAIYRANAVRALCLITDESGTQNLQRILETAIKVKTHPSVSTAALVSAYHLYAVARHALGRQAGPSWLEEVYKIAEVGGSIRQYHALGFLYLIISQRDPGSVKILVDKYSGRHGTTLRDPAAICMLIRYACKGLEKSDPKKLHKILEDYLRHGSDMVNLEAARAICEMPGVPKDVLGSALTLLQIFLSSSKSTLKFAAIRVLYKLSLTNIAAVAKCNKDIARLVRDPARSVSSFAITTLIRTGDEYTVDDLMEEIPSIMNEVPDDFKAKMVDALRSLCLKFPGKQGIILTFLNNRLREEGGYGFKKSIVETMFDMVKAIPESKDAALSNLCEFIEDCEFTKLSVRILHLLGNEGPKTKTPTKYIRHIYNRVILENSVIRAAAVSALAKFGVNVDDPLVKKSVRVLLARCMDDSDDEVRDRATLYFTLMDNSNIAQRYLKDDSTFALPTLEQQLAEYIGSPLQNEAFDLTSVPVVSKAHEEEERRRTRTQELLPIPNLPGTSETSSEVVTTSLDQQALYAEQLRAIPEFSTFGKLFKSSEPTELTEPETEYRVTCIKHIYPRHIVFQFDCTNTLEDLLLENVEVDMVDEESEMTLVHKISIEKLGHYGSGTAYAAYELQNDPLDGVKAFFENRLLFTVKEVDPATGEPEVEGFPDEHKIADLEVQTGDFIRPTFVSDFEGAWKQAEYSCEAVETYELENAPSLKVACDKIIKPLCMEPLEDSSLPKNSSVHKMILAGTVIGGTNVLALCRMNFKKPGPVTFQLAVRSNNQDISDFVLSATEHIEVE